MTVVFFFFLKTWWGILPLGLDRQRGTRIYKNTFLIFYSSTVTLLRSGGVIGERDFSKNSRPLIVLKLRRDQYTMLVFHWSRLTPMQCLFSIGHGIHPRNACFSLDTAYTYTMLVFIGQGLHPRNACLSLITSYTYTLFIFHWLWFTPTQCLLFISHMLILRNAYFSLAIVFTHAMLVFH